VPALKVFFKKNLFLFYLIGTIGILGGIGYFCRKKFLSRISLYSGIWLLVSFAPFYFYLCRRYLYLPSVGFCVFFSSLFLKPLRQNENKARKVLFFLILFFGGCLAREISIWRTAGKISANIIEDLTKLHPTPSRGDTIYILNLPVVINRVPILTPEGIEADLKRKNFSSSLKVRSLSQVSLTDLKTRAQIQVLSPRKIRISLPASLHTHFFALSPKEKKIFKTKPVIKRKLFEIAILKTIHYYPVEIEILFKKEFFNQKNNYFFIYDQGHLHPFKWEKNEEVSFRNSSLL
jgi:hypothetical protein